MSIKNKDDLFSIEQIVLDSSATTQDEAFQELATIAYKAGCIDNIDKLTKALWAREHETSTGLEDGFAIPHARIKYIKKPAVIFVRYQTGLSWPTFDNSAVQVAIALIIPTNKKNDIHLEVLSNVAKKLLNPDLRQTLKTENDKTKILALLQAEDEPTTVTKENYKGYVLGITACPAGVAHTYMAAKKIEDEAKRLGYAVKVEKQGANGFEDKLTPEDIQNANVLIIAADIAIGEQERFVDIPILKVAVSEPLHDVDGVFKKAFQIMRQLPNQQIPTTKQIKTKKEKGWFKLHFKTGAVSLKNAVLTGISYAVPVIVAGTAIQALITIIIQIAGADYIVQHANWLNTLSNVAGKSLSILLAPVLAAYIAYAMADKPGLTPGFLGGLACVYVTKTAADGTVIVDGLGFLGGLITGMLVGYMMKLFKKYLVSQKMQGVLTWFVYPMLGSLISMCVILFVIGQPIALLINVIFSGLTTLQTSNLAALLGIIIGMMCVFDLGGPFNKVVWAFSFASFSQAFTGGQLTNPTLLVPYACFWAAGIGTGWTTALVTFIGRRFSNQYEKEAGKMAWILSSLGITEGAIPFALSDPFRVIPSFMLSGAVSGGLCAAFNLGSTITGGGFITMAGIQSTTGTVSIGVAILLWLIFAIIGCAISTSLLLGLKYIKTKPIIEKKVQTWTVNILSLGIVPVVKKQHLKKFKQLSSREQEQYLNHKQRKNNSKIER
ncbi:MULTISPECIES: fructose-specific PTS transporter subunit EIIC [Spiroplasma]|uniref:fructose-specific PTS transporter subunit EIIC n=1 Tax=Spiroplasma TaxID=2132 RepID=UPI0018DB6219|nr:MULTISPECIES: fructose-specific PTS transporter subunit EIIC [Spiroplasma]MBH8622859.1 PTS mannosyl-D-glycerate transporter subunit IIABC [Spiroplasma sp. hyd1]UNF62608.1 fructose-specific PTS transporter subunit EIIC [Spiroplasma poulsonii]